MILPKHRDPRFITLRRGGTLSDDDHHLLALWAAACAEHVVSLFEAVRPDDPRPRFAIELARAWTRGEVSMTDSRSAAGHANAAARDLQEAPRFAAYACAQAAAVAHVAAHELGAAAYAIKAARASAPPVRANMLAASNASGNATICPKPFALSSWTTNACETISAGMRSATDHPPRRIDNPRRAIHNQESSTLEVARALRPSRTPRRT